MLSFKSKKKRMKDKRGQEVKGVKAEVLVWENSRNNEGQYGKKLLCELFKN